MATTNIHLLLADDDIDDCNFFKEATAEINRPIAVTTVNDGVQLMDYLRSDLSEYPNLIFLDLNMPKKSGLECITEIKSIRELNDIPIVIYSTSLDRSVVNHLYDVGAHKYIQKPNDFNRIISVIEKTINFLFDEIPAEQSRDQFIIQP
ncbi:response regulator [Winogradskyella ouciana]|uniref:Response regulator n=1 Tax=Winogradskyella ouciana TaxID=2608631 RepID=A0A7K1G9I5_9FLAO|nr:response regulator [Winogradskyella ouciana]MTE25946.1 response regulator [Winogradskyella ouciana]